ncbi:MAG: NifU family protein [Actinomycetota bacterium]|jgi:Fe/S biogenesis protein NfuA|uniref:NIF system FeS cluster assembly NifU C-terminal domain-containing protein n=1 Tax=marine metagenome TaxID=408172 RepID=A0A381QR86_9ZZZZ|nr:NifU family protein [Actinomycetota bacterium]MEE3114920.1 NifU family protein [Actinomycetota bacterium]|tara:strand:+ start:154 stop:792 length:639 start_codon:yes stop_codon:yes gene_type:complete
MSETDTYPDERVDQLMTVTEAALAKVLEVRNEEDDPAGLALRVSITGSQGVDYVYDLAFFEIAAAPEDDVRWEVDDLSFLIPAEDREKLAGATLDLPSNPTQGGLVIRNPNRPNPLGDIGTLELTGEIPEQVGQLIAERINPALASHGGYATLVGIEGSTAYVTMGGGCQGCSMSAATLTEGIRSAILEAVPEILEVVDATDHSAGENPFYS